MQSKPPGPLESYNSLTDENLAGFFANPEKRKYLQRMGLITHDGRILDEESIRRHHLHEEHKMKSKHLMTEALVKKAVELERKRRGELKKKMDQLSKFEMAEKIKYQLCNPMGVAHLDPTYTTYPPKLSATLFKRQEQLQLTQNQFDELDYMVRHVTASKSLPGYYISPYLRPRLPSAPRPKHTTNMRIRAKRIKRPQTAPSGIGTSLFINDKIHTNVCMRFCYLGSGVNVRSPYHAKVRVDQQHCGGNTICLFEGHLQPNDEFTIFSRRHYGMPLGLSMYIDGMINCRLSSCCEYKHYPGQMVGGKSAHFRLLQVNGGKPCYLCELRSKRSSKSSRSKEPHSDLVTPDVLHEDIMYPLDKDQQEQPLEQLSLQVEEYQDDFEDDIFEDENEDTYVSDFESQSHTTSSVEATPLHSQGDSSGLSSNTHQPSKATPTKNDTSTLEYHNESPETHSTSESEIESNKEKNQSATSKSEHFLEDNPETQSTPCRHSETQSPEHQSEHSETQVTSLENNTTAYLEAPSTEDEHPETQSTPDNRAKTQSQSEHSQTQSEHSILNPETTEEHPETQSTHAETQSLEHQSENPEIQSISAEQSTLNKHPETQSTPDKHTETQSLEHQSENPEISTSPEHSAPNVEPSKEHSETQSTPDEYAEIQPSPEERPLSNNELLHIASSLVQTVLTGALKQVNNNNHIENEPSDSSLLESDSEIREYLQTILDRAKSYVQNLVTNKGENSSYEAGQVESEVSLPQHHSSTSSSSTYLDNYGAGNGRKNRLEERQYIETSSQDEEQHESQFIVRNRSESLDHKYFNNRPSSTQHSSETESSPTNRTYSV